MGILITLNFHYYEQTLFLRDAHSAIKCGIAIVKVVLPSVRQSVRDVAVP